MKDNITYEPISFEILHSDDVFSALQNHMVWDKFDLLVMLEKERSGIIDKIFHEDLIKKMEFHTRVPLLSYNERFLLTSNDKDIKKSDTIEN